MGYRGILASGIVMALVAQGGLIERRALAADQSAASRSTHAAGAGGARSVWDGVYSAEQAERGKFTFDRACASCHAPDLRGAGDATLALTGPGFLGHWNGHPLSDLYLKVGREQGDQTKTMMRP